MNKTTRARKMQPSNPTREAQPPNPTRGMQTLIWKVSSAASYIIQIIDTIIL